MIPTIAYIFDGYYYMLSDILSDMHSDIQSDIFSDILSDNLYNTICLTFYLTYIRAFYPTWKTDIQSDTYLIRHSLWHVMAWLAFLSDIYLIYSNLAFYFMEGYFDGNLVKLLNTWLMGEFTLGVMAKPAGFRVVDCSKFSHLILGEGKPGCCKSCKLETSSSGTTLRIGLNTHFFTAWSNMVWNSPILRWFSHAKGCVCGVFPIAMLGCWMVHRFFSMISMDWFHRKPSIFPWRSCHCPGGE